MKFEIINPHDECYMEAPDIVTGLAAVLLIGEGAYGIRGEGFDSGLALFGQDLTKKTYEAAGIASFNDLFDVNRGRLQTDPAFNEAVAVACESIHAPAGIGSTVNLVRLGQRMAEALRRQRTFASAEATHP